jgi:hypothetical protein
VNVTHALGALGGQIGSRRRGRGGVHGHARAELARGIGPFGRGWSGGEVTARSVVGGALPLLGAHGGHGDALGERGVDERCLCEVGSGEGASRSGDRPLGVGLVEQKGEREGFWQGLALGSPPPHRSNQIGQQSISGKILCWAKNNMLMNPLGLFALKEKER